VANNLSGGVGVHAWHTNVSTNIGVVNIDDVSSSKVLNTIVVDPGVGSSGDDGGTESGGSAKEGTAVSLGVEGGLGRGLCVRGKRSGGAKEVRRCLERGTEKLEL
jgi:hypothetical protein